jgi:hypothetical protein
MNKTSKVVVIIVFVVVILFGVGQFFAFSNINSNTSSQPTTQTPAPAASPTQVIAFVASIPASSTPTESGSCFASSIAAPYRSDAWRCTVGNAISDPCFRIAGSNDLLCGVNPAEGPYATSTFVLHLTKALPAPSTPGATPANWAWAVQLADGTYCTPFTGTRPFTASGTVGYYACSSPNPDESMIFGDLNASSSAWTAEVGALTVPTSSLPTVAYSEIVPVLTVWQ